MQKTQRPLHLETQNNKMQEETQRLSSHPGFRAQERRLLVGFSLILLLLVGTITYSLSNFSHLVEADRLNVHTYQVLLKINEVRQDTVQVETTLRTFLLTGDERHLRAYTRAQKDFAYHHAQLSYLTRDNGEQQNRLPQLKHQLEQWLRDVGFVVQTRRAITDDAQSLLITTRTSLQRSQGMQEIRSLLGIVENTEQLLLQSRSSSLDELQRRAGQNLIMGGVLSVFIVCGFGFLMLGNARQLHRANARLQRNSAQIEATNRELKELNASLQRSNREAQRANADLKGSNADLEQFAYVASHDLQEPLRAVSGCVQILQRRYAGQLDERAETLIQHAVDGAQRMQTLIYDLLAYSRVGTKGREFVVTDFNSILNRVRSNLGVAISESGAQITHEPLPTIEVDGGQIEQVMQNLVSNALKFRSESAPQIHIGARRDEENKEWVFSVKDDGLGIETQYFERIWVMFQRLHTRTEFPGTGIGLAICKKIVERHGGRVSVQSEVGHGATFSFSIPDVKPEESVSEETVISD